ncbi:AAA family ATPase [Chitinophaga oryziterrae]|uniref:AAA family ATPase n=1 Tax=Chitinophaga oryziterrae TaxID=1031224 RepID=A0A6N8JAV4_9BACT|nr:zeta toxin family protein [Chitinophaga oryziterrae]MVT42360.1 AAA family ATPase [Chitinophaga oryziterrae]
MDYNKPTLLVISGPNGAGKSTYINDMLPDTFEGIVSFDRDDTRSHFESQLKEEKVAEDQISAIATRMMEDRLSVTMNQAIEAHRHFVLETPLSHPDYWRYIDRFERNGYQIQLCYLCLDKVSDCKVRVEHRVMMGGHHVDARTIKGVYEMNLHHINLSLDTFQCIELYDGMIKPTLLVKIENGEVILAKESALKKTWVKTGLPLIATKTTAFLKLAKK